MNLKNLKLAHVLSDRTNRSNTGSTGNPHRDGNKTMTLNEMNGQDPVDHICSKRKKEKKRKRIIHQINKNLTPSLSPSLAVVGSILADEKAFLPLSSLERDKDSRVWCYRIKELHHLICESRIFSAWFILSSEMERDFMGLSSKEPLAVVKEEIIEGGKDSGSVIHLCLFIYLLLYLFNFD